MLQALVYFHLVNLCGHPVTPTFVTNEEKEEFYCLINAHSKTSCIDLSAHGLCYSYDNYCERGSFSKTSSVKIGESDASCQFRHFQ